MKNSEELSLEKLEQIETTLKTIEYIKRPVIGKQYIQLYNYLQKNLQEKEITSFNLKYIPLDNNGYEEKNNMNMIEEEKKMAETNTVGTQEEKERFLFDINPNKEQEKVVVENKVDTYDSKEERYKKIENILFKNGFIIGSDKLMIVNDSGKAKTISNFIPYVVKKITITNGADIEFRYILSGIVLNTKQLLPEIEITKEEYFSFKFIIGSEWEGQAIINGNNNIYLRQITQILVNETSKKEERYQHTGFEKIGDQLIYLYQGGAIGKQGTMTDIKAELTNDKLEQYCFTQKNFETVETLKTALSILDLAEKNITVPLIATTYLSVLVSILQEEGIYADYILYLMGKSGSRKSTVAALMLSHFGNNFQRNNFPSSFRDTLNNLEKKAFILKDTLNVIDDLNPETGAKTKITVFEKITAMYADRVGRGRMKTDGKGLRNPYTARGTCIATGEIIPNIPMSRLARTIIIPVKKDSINLEKLTNLQINREKLAYSMMLFISWVITNEQYIKQKAKNIMLELQKKQNNEVHGRTNESINIMYIGYEFFLEFMKCNNILSEEDQHKLLDEGYNILFSICNNQQEEIEVSNPINMFYDAIDELISTNKIYLLDYKTGVPLTNNNGKLAGYLNKEKDRYYFFESIIYGEVCKLYAINGNNFPLTALSLWKYLQEEGYMENKSRKTVERTDPLTRNKIRVVDVMKKSKLS